MKFVRKYFFIIFFVALLINFIFWDFIDDKSFNLKENIFQSVFMILFYAFFSWGWNGKDYKRNNSPKLKDENCD